MLIELTSLLLYKINYVIVKIVTPCFYRPSWQVPSGRGKHIYKSAWTPLTDKARKCILREDNERDKYAINN